MRFILKISVTLLLILISARSFSANIDSLLILLNKSKSDTNKINLLIKLGDEYRNSTSDSALLFFNQAIQIAKKHSMEKNSIYLLLQAKSLRHIGLYYREYEDYNKAIEYYLSSAKISNQIKDKKELSECYNNIGVAYYYLGEYKKATSYYIKALNLSKEIKDIDGMIYCYSNIGNIHSNQGNYPEALANFQKSLDLATKIKDQHHICSCYHNIGNVYSRQGNYKMAVEFYVKSLKISEANKDLIAIASTSNNLGSIHYFQGNYDKALEYYTRALNISKKTQNQNEISNSYTNLGNVYKDKLDYKKALDYYTKSLNLFVSLKDIVGISVCYTNIGNVYAELGSYYLAIENYKKSLKIDTELGDKNGEAMGLANLAALNINLADSAALTEGQRIKYLKEAVFYGLQAEEIAKEIKVLPVLSDVVFYLKKSYHKLGNIEKAFEYSEYYTTTRDSLYNIEKNKALTELEIQYKTEKRQLEIDKLEKEKALQNETIARKNVENHKQQLIIYFFIVGFIIIIFFSLVIYRLFIQKKKANILLAEQKHQIEEKNEELNQQNEEITTQRDEIEAQRDEITTQRDTVVKQKELIENIHREQTDSIHYAKRIQSAILPEMSIFSAYNFEHFVLFKPLNIVSGDFYWSANIDQKLIFCVADCTGHGVPGAFMSMLAISLLNEIVKKEKITDAASILNHLRENIIESLQQQGSDNENSSTLLMVQDGMDMSLCVLDISTLKLQYAGANNPVYIIQNTPVILSGVEDKGIGHASSPLSMTYNLVELKPDKMPIAIYVKLDPFNNQEIQLSKGDMIYLFSDGFADQFGGSKGRKFLYSKFKEMLVKINTLTTAEQSEIILQSFTDWKGNHEQVDDITIMGLKI